MALNVKYRQVEAMANNYACRDDIITYQYNNTLFKGTVLFSQGDYVVVEVEGLGRQRIRNNTFSYVERYINRVGKDNIPVELNDYVAIIVNKELVFGKVAKVISAQQVQLAFTSPKVQYNAVNININQIRFVSKGYYTVNEKPVVQTRSPHVDGIVNTMHQQNSDLISQDSTASNCGQAPVSSPTPPPSRTIDTILVDAPCVVKVVPFDVEPDQFDDLMIVDYPSENSDTSIMPLIRMKCGTILVVRAPPDQ